jgi:diaminopimelate epimerase
MKLQFTKMHGLGNDFVVIDGVNQVVQLNAEQIRGLADRHFGVGCDQVLLVEPPITANADFQYRIFNADGGEVAQCGNGARCFARFVRENNLTNKNEIVVDTAGGQLVLHIDGEGLVTVNMGAPKHQPGQIPMLTPEEATLYDVQLNSGPVRFAALSMGNPHVVIRVEDCSAAPVALVGAELESHPLFPERVNVGFMQIIDRQCVKLRVYERGAAETLACGSGACAAVVAGVEQSLLDSPVRVMLQGGDLFINWRGRGNPVFMSGPTATVFKGQIEI